MVPTNGNREGSYGADSAGIQRQPGISSCREQAIFGGCGTVDVDPGNQAPVITSTPGTTADHNRPWEYRIQVSDPDGDPLEISFDLKPSWMDYNPQNRTLTAIAGWDNVGSHQVRIRASDGLVE